MGRAGREVEQFELVAFVEKFLRFTWAVEVNPSLPKAFQLRECGGGTVDVDTPWLGGGDAAAQDELAFLAGGQTEMG